MLSAIGIVSLVAAAAVLQPEARKDPAYVLGHTVRTIEGEERPLSAYRGKVVMIVNVASACGLTPQYEGLQKIYTQYKDKGFVILGFPANNFMGQEPGTNEEIKEFCTGTYRVTFPMFEKIVVKGEGVHPLYEQLAAQPAPPAGVGGEPKWNFTKFLVDRQGRVVARFEPKVKLDDPALVKKVEELLAEKAPMPKEPTTAGS